MVAPTLPALLSRSTATRRSRRSGFMLHTAGAQIDEVELGFFTRLLNTLIDPNIISLLFLAGIAGIGFEIFHPGVVLPGALGAVALVTALFGFSVLPVTGRGSLILLGIALLVVDAHVVEPRRADALGARSASPSACCCCSTTRRRRTQVSSRSSSSVAVVLGGFWAFAMAKAVQVRRRPVAVGPQHVVGATGEVRARRARLRPRRALAGAARTASRSSRASASRSTAVDGLDARRSHQRIGSGVTAALIALAVVALPRRAVPRSRRSRSRASTSAGSSSGSAGCCPSRRGRASSS